MADIETTSEQQEEETFQENHREETITTLLSNHERAHLSVWDAVTLLLGIQIGSGIFVSPSQVDNNVRSPFVALLAWLVSGALAWTGATSFAELGCLFPVNGGMQEYLRQMQGDAVAAVMAWTWIAAVKPSSMAILSITLVESMGSVIVPEVSLEHSLIAKLITIFALILIMLLNCMGSRTSAKFGRIFVALKLLAVGLVFLAGIVVVLLHIFGLGGTHSSLSSDWYDRNWLAARPTLLEGTEIDWSSMSMWTSLGYFSNAIYAGLWAFSGWDNANFVASEIRDPKTSLPFAIHTAMTVLIVCYELVNSAYYILLPWETVSSSDSVAVTAALSLVGPTAGFLMATLISISCAGAISVNILVVSRLIVAASEQRYLPTFFGITGFPYQSPNAMIFSTVLTSVYILIGNFRTLLVYVGLAEYTFFCLTVLGLIRIRLRRGKDRQEKGLYRPWIVIPIGFCGISFAVILRTFLFSPVQSMAFLGLVLGGIAIYIFSIKMR
ncbi:amino acid/polyamine transporter I [Tricladium varicosporioides]|nr:amino acid/polyamine transporter I [Hymenoscyphus varicosporioides]